MIPQEYIAELARRTDISELVGSYVPLKRAGRLEKGLCPFHNEKTPSFTVYPDTASYYCFGCGAGGDAINFIMRLQNLSYPDAVKLLAARAGMPLPEEDDGTAQARIRLLGANRAAARFFVDRLNADEGTAARAYLRGRALSDATIRRFGLGYSPDSFDALSRHLAREGYGEAELVEAGLVKRGQRGGVYDAFRGRVMFPIIDLRGNVIAFGGRQLGEGRGPKYLNSADTPVFKKSRELYALVRAKKEPSRRYLLAEGYMDVISLHQAGFATAVATLGTALTAEQAKLISNYADEVVICYDADEAGQKATARAISILKNTTLKVGVLALPGAKDPDEYIAKYGADRFSRVLDGSGNTIEYALRTRRDKFDLGTADGRAGYIRAALEVLAAEAKPAERDIYAGRIAEETDVAKAAVLAQLDGVVRARERKWRKERDKRALAQGNDAGLDVPFTGSRDKALSVAFAEQQLVAAALKNPAEHLPRIAAQVDAGDMAGEEMAAAWALMLARHRAGEPVELATLAGELPEKTLSKVSRVLADRHDIVFSAQDVDIFIQRVKEGARRRAAPGALDDEAVRDYMEDMRRRKKPE